MNLILFAPAELARPLPLTDRRAVHVLTVLRRNIGDTFDAGVINGPRGKATLVAADATALRFTFAPSAAPTAATASTPHATTRLTLIVGLTRPQTARDILRDATTLGAAELHFVRTEKSEPSYAQSTLWSSGEWRRHVLAGAEQAFATNIPAVTVGETLRATLAGLAPSSTPRLALDNYEGAIALGDVALPKPFSLSSALSSTPASTSLALAIGGERGWSAAERTLLRDSGFTLVHLGERVLRTETAVVAALAIVRSRLALP